MPSVKPKTSRNVGKSKRTRITAGRALYLLRSTFQHGLKTAYYRDFVRHRILRSNPVVDTDNDACEIHVLTSKNDWLNLIWVLKSLFQFEECRFRLCIHEDGTVPFEGVAHLKRLFPRARFIDRETADKKLEAQLKDHPRSKHFRFSNPFSLKVFDFAAFLENERMFLVDSDILFFSPPAEILSRISNPSYTNNSLNKDWAYGYSVPIETLNVECDFPVQSHINSGLGLIHRDSISLELVEQFLGLPGVLDYRHRIEQTLIALCSCKYGYEMLPKEYDVSMEKTNFDVPSKHYTSPIRHLMYREGVAKLAGKLNSAGKV